MKTKFGVESEMLVEEFLQKGFDSASQVLLRAAARLKETRQGLYYLSCKQLKSFSSLMIFKENC